jgi:aspartate racemase
MGQVTDMKVMLSRAEFLLLPAGGVLAGQTRKGRPPAAWRMKTLGLIGGTSWHSTIEYYRYINQAVNDVYGDNTNPPLILYNLNQQHIHALQLEDRWDEIASLLAEAATKLVGAGAGAVLFCANTPHKVYAQVSRKTGVPILHIGDATGRAIRRAGLTKVGLIGTIYTMQDSFLRDWLYEKYHIEVVTPSSQAVRNELQRIIQKELGMGIFKEKTKGYVLVQMTALRRLGAQGIVLGCTEFPLIIHQSDVSYPVFDTTKLHSEMAVDFILGGDQRIEAARRPRV